MACLSAVYGFYVWETALHWIISHRKKGKHGHGDQNHHHHGRDDHHDHSHIPDPKVFKEAMVHSKATVVSCDGPEIAMKEHDVQGKNTEVAVVQRQAEGICGNPSCCLLLMPYIIIGILHLFRRQTGSQLCAGYRRWLL